MALQTRNTLKEFFRKDKKPTEGNFHDLIDSMYNRLDDGNDLVKSGLPQPIKPPDPTIQTDLVGGFRVSQKNDGKPLFVVDPSGNIGVGVSSPSYQLQLSGEIASGGRVGIFGADSIDPNSVLADGNWHPILGGLDGLNAFEIVAMASGAKGQGEYAVLYAIALSAYGKSKSRILHKSARYKGLFRNIQLRWSGEINNYNLEIRTRKKFGQDVKIKYSITQLICP
jgi:hypothetical protein